MVVDSHALILLNGPSASGKFTLAGRLVGFRPLALSPDIDVAQGQLADRWIGALARPRFGGLAAACRPPRKAGHELPNRRRPSSPEHLDR